MSKYIDAEKLIAEIDRRNEGIISMNLSFDQFWAGQISAFKCVKTIITSLQQEHQEVDFEEEWEKFNSWMETYNQSDYPTSYTTKDIARYFAEWGANHLNARKEE